MGVNVLGISGSPIKNSNTDRLIKAMLDATGCESEFIKLSEINVRPCMGCKQCVTDNICKVEDDFQALSLKIQKAKGIIFGAYTPYGQIDGFTKALLERFWSLRHVNNLLQGKLCATVLTCLMPEMAVHTNQALTMELVHYEHMDMLGQITVSGNLPCMTCGQGDECEMSGVTMIYGEGAKTSDHGYCRVEDQTETWEEANTIGTRMGKLLTA
ncbi:MAG: flavodoxin family protein [Desulfobacteraceae bacterium]|nr:flavodoxin family protein [Desulfobacteraceae bacterium]